MPKPLAQRCIHGHPMTAGNDNVGTWHHGTSSRRVCRSCARERSRRSKASQQVDNRRSRARADRHCRWTPTDVELFKRLESRGLSDAQLAAALGRTLRGIEAARRRLRLTA